MNTANLFSKSTNSYIFTKVLKNRSQNTLFLADLKSHFGHEKRGVYYCDFNERSLFCKSLKIAKITSLLNTKNGIIPSDQEKKHGVRENNRPPWPIFFQKNNTFWQKLSNFLTVTPPFLRDFDQLEGFKKTSFFEKYTSKSRKISAR